MIKVKIERGSKHRIQSFELSGHAESGPYGYDLVCAGVSAVSIGTVNAIYKLCNVEPQVEQKEQGGFLRCVIPKELQADTQEKVQLLLEGMIVSLQTIEDEYGSHITINEHTVGGE